MENKDINAHLEELQKDVSHPSDEETGLYLAQAILNAFLAKSGKDTLAPALLTFNFEDEEDIDLSAELYDRLFLAVQVVNRFAKLVTEYNVVLPLDKLKKVALGEISELWEAMKKKAVSGNRGRTIGGRDDRAIWALAINVLDENKHTFKYINKDQIESIIESLDGKEDSKKGPVLTPTQKKRAFINILSEKILKDQGIMVRGIQDFLTNH